MIATTNAFYAVGVGAAYVAPVAKMSQSKVSKTQAINEAFVLYPNPAVEVLNITIKDNKESGYRIYNSLGFEVQSGKTTSGDINVNKLSKGIYFFELNDGENTTTKTFIKK